MVYFFIIPYQCESGAEAGAMSPAFFPKMGTILLIILSAIFSAVSLKQDRRQRPESDDALAKKIRWNVFFTAVFIALYLVALALAGFLTATPLFLILMMIILGARLRNWITILTTTAVSTLVIYYFFIKALGLPMP